MPDYKKLFFIMFRSWVTHFRILEEAKKLCEELRIDQDAETIELIMYDARLRACAVLQEAQKICEEEEKLDLQAPQQS